MRSEPGNCQSLEQARLFRINGAKCPKQNLFYIGSVLDTQDVHASFSARQGSLIDTDTRLPWRQHLASRSRDQPASTPEWILQMDGCLGLSICSGNLACIAAEYFVDHILREYPAADVLANAGKQPCSIECAARSKPAEHAWHIDSHFLAAHRVPGICQTEHSQVGTYVYLKSRIQNFPSLHALAVEGCVKTNCSVQFGAAREAKRVQLSMFVSEIIEALCNLSFSSCYHCFSELANRELDMAQSRDWTELQLTSAFNCSKNMCGNPVFQLYTPHQRACQQNKIQLCSRAAVLLVLKALIHRRPIKAGCFSGPKFESKTASRFIPDMCLELR